MLPYSSDHHLQYSHNTSSGVSDEIMMIKMKVFVIHRTEEKMGAKNVSVF